IGATSKMMAAFLMQATSGAAGILGNPLTMMVIVMGIFYVMLILPQQRQRKKVQAMLQALKSGDKVITSSGIYVTVNGIDVDTIIFKVADQVKFRIVRSAIAQETDQMVDRLNKQLRDKKIPFDEIRRVDDTHILVRNVDSTQGSAFRDFITQQYGNYWDASSATGEPNGYLLTLRQSAIAT